MTATLADATTTPGAQELVARAESLQDRLRNGAAEADRTRWISEDDVTAVRDAGLFRLLVPSRFGGHAAGCRTVVDVTAALGQGCTSTGWVTGALNAGNWLVAQFPEQAQREVWGSTPDATATIATVPTATVSRRDGGLRVSGRWPGSAGVGHCGWAVVGVPGADPSRAPVDLVLLDMGEVRVEDTWHVTGMRGTGSHTIVADDVVVPHHRVLPMTSATGGAAAAHDPVHRTPLSCLLPLCLLGAQVGAAESALTVVLENASEPAIAYSTGCARAGSPAFAVDVADASSRIETARLLGRGVAGEMDEYAARGELPPGWIRTRARLSIAAAAVHTREAVDLLLTAHGPSAFTEASPLQRIWRDTALASRHLEHRTRVAQEAHGRALLGLDPRLADAWL